MIQKVSYKARNWGKKSNLKFTKISWLRTKTKPKATSFIYQRDLKGSTWLYLWTTTPNKLWKVNKLTKTIISKNKWLRKTKATSETKWGPKYLPIERTNETRISSWASRWLTGRSLLVFIMITWRKAFRIKITRSINLKGTRLDSQVKRDQTRFHLTEIPIRAVTFNSRSR